ncbi:MAG: hypothetical protein M1598_02290 [Actinobacteria bacterium]|nr:hypothetical protein [Actinomycetota bacterium]
MNWLDALIAAALVIGAVSGWHRGLIALAFGLAGTFLSFYLAAKFSGILAQLVETKLHWVTGTARFLATVVPVPSFAAKIRLSILPVADLLRQLDGLKIPPELRDYVATFARQALETPGSAAPTTVADLLFRAMAMAVWAAISFLVIMSVTAWIIRLISATLNYVTGKGPTGLPNHAGGALVGALEAGLGLVVLAGLAAPFLTFAGGPALGKTLEGSRFLPYLLRWFQALYSWAT